MPEWLKTIYTSPAKTLRAFCLVFVGSIAFTSLRNSLFDKQVLVFIFGAMFLFLSFAILALNKKSVRFIFLILVAILFGIWRFGVGQVSCRGEAVVCGKTNAAIELIGKIVEAPNEKLGSVEYVVEPANKSDERIKQPYISVVAESYPKYNFGDTVSLECKLKLPENKADSTFDYVKYLASRGVGAVCGYPKSFTLYVPGTMGVYNYILLVKQKLETRVEQLWAEPASSLMAGILYGSQSNLPTSIKNEFSVSGLSHIIAVSGFNVSIIAMVLLVVFTRAGMRRQVAVLLALVTIWLFVLMVGASASAVRAGIMASVVLVAELLGKLPNVGSTLIFVVTLMALQNPYVILWDIGFQLSFVATLGLVYGTPILEQYVSKIKFLERVPFVVEAASTTLGAIIATLPTMLYYFGSFSPLSLFANILVVPLVPWLMLVGAIALGVSVLLYPLGFAVAFVANIGLQYILFIVQLFGKPSLAMHFGLPWWGVVIIYVVLTVYVQRKSKSMFVPIGV